MMETNCSFLSILGVTIKEEVGGNDFLNLDFCHYCQLQNVLRH